MQVPPAEPSPSPTPSAASSPPARATDSTGVETRSRHILSSALAALVLLAASGGAATAQTRIQTQPETPTEHEPASQPAPSDSAERRPKAARRTVRVFDFEERFTNALEVPEGWVRAQHDPLVPRDRPGFPIWNLAELDYSVAATGEGSVRLDVEGGSASLRLKAGMLPVFPLGEYAVRAVVRTEGLGNARPRLVVRALDRTGAPIPGTQRQTILESLDEQWQPIEVTLPGIFPDAAYLQIDLEVIQPREFLRESLLEHQVWEQDFDGAAWFDDLVIMQVPQLHLETTAPLNVVTRPDIPTLTADLRDLAAEKLTATTRVYDARRRLVAETTRAIRTGRETWEWTPELVELGWYSAVIEVASAEQVVARKVCDFVWLPASTDPRNRYLRGPGFDGSATNAAPGTARNTGIQLSVLPPGEPDEIALALRSLGAQSVTLPIWERDLRAQDVPARVDRLRDIVAALRAEWIEPKLSLPVVPDELAVPLRLRPQDVLDVLAADPEVWEPYLSDAMDRLGTGVWRWQIGASGNAEVYERATASDDIRTVRAQFARYIPGVEISAGWRLDWPTETAAATGIDAASITLPPWTATTPMDLATQPWRENLAVLPEYVLEPLDSAHLTERDIAAELARRTVRLWAAQANGTGPAQFRTAISDPWTIAGGEHISAQPRTTAAVWQTLADRLSGREFAGEWSVGAGVRCFVFAPTRGDAERGGLIVAWREDAPFAASVLHAALGDAPVTVTDIFGNQHTVEPAAASEDVRHAHTIPLTSDPVFVEGIDTNLVRFLASLTLSPSRIQSVAGERVHEVVITNPWPVAAAGRLIITEPGGYNARTRSRDRSWTITPRSMPFDVPAGQTVRLPVTLSFSRAIETGPIDVTFDVQLVAERDHGWVRARVPAAIVLDGVELDVAYRRPLAGPDADLIVEATITNTGDRVRSFDAFAFATGMPRVRASIGALEPGQSIVRSFPFSKAAAALAGQRVVVSIAEADGPGRLTAGVDVLSR